MLATSSELVPLNYILDGRVQMVLWVDHFFEGGIYEELQRYSWTEDLLRIEKELALFYFTLFLNTDKLFDEQ